MALNSDPLRCKELFLEENKAFSEIKFTDESKSIGKLHEFDLMANEIWLLQCPKGMDISELQNQKLKIPGRTNIDSSEAVCMEFNEGNEQHTFAYVSRKGRYALRLLPVRGTIIVRDRLKASSTVTVERVQECTVAEKVHMPASIRVRHPLLGAKYEDKLELNKSTMERLEKADKISALVLKDSLNRRNKSNSRANLHNNETKDNISSIEINSADDAVEFVSEKKLEKKRKKSKKRKHSESNADVSVCKLDSKNKIKADEEFVSKDLEWIKNT